MFKKLKGYHDFTSLDRKRLAALKRQHLFIWLLTMNTFTVPAVLTVDNSVVDLETIEALYENVSMEKKPVWHNKAVKMILYYNTDYFDYHKVMYVAYQCKYYYNYSVYHLMLQHFFSTYLAVSIHASWQWTVLCLLTEGHQWWDGQDNETLWERKRRWSQTAGQTWAVSSSPPSLLYLFKK